MGDLFSLFWEVDPPSLPLSVPIPNQDFECQKDISCGAIGNFLLWYFTIMLAMMFFSRASVWISERKKEEDAGTSTSVSKESKESSHNQPSKDGTTDASEEMKNSKLSQLTAVTDSEVALANAYIERRARLQTQFSQDSLPELDSDTTEHNSEESISESSSWKESESEHSSPVGFKKKKLAQRQRNLANFQVRGQPCLHCKAKRTNEWLTRHFHPGGLLAIQMNKDIQEKKPVSDISPICNRI
ncbi:serine-rich single-pass membrane protein 1 [Suncus etruscus]|uniref:serine-rich single-pass membrane protein 1 n=1 Tax=Suncus etruscus TaxID=109475 RepID=UPI0021103172|nr:serine-rich single-pass membrane protein 1 [Suncus etruscus]